MARFHIVSSIYVPFGWDATGGSEEHHIRLAEELAARGHDVTSYTPLPNHLQDDTLHNGVIWLDISHIDRSEPGIWIIQRDPTLAELWPKTEDQLLCFAAHDLDYGKGWTEHYDIIMADSEYHAAYLRQVHGHPNVVATGVAPQFQRIGEVPQVTRNPKRLMWSSSYTRGLDCLLWIYRRALEQVPDLELYVAMGWDSIDSRKDPAFTPFKEKVNKQMEELKVHHLGRLPTSVDVWTEYAKSGMWAYPSMWCETGCQTIMEAQAFGAIPIFNPHWGVLENGHHGIRIWGDPYTDQLIRTRFVQEIVNLATNPELQEKIRAEMMPHARELFAFSKVVDRVEEHTSGKIGKAAAA